MDSVIGWLGLISTVLAVLVAWATWDRRRMRVVIIDTLLEMGVIRYDRDENRRIKPSWPNGCDNLPDTLDAIYRRLDRNQTST